MTLVDLKTVLATIKKAADLINPKKDTNSKGDEILKQPTPTNVKDAVKALTEVVEGLSNIMLSEKKENEELKGKVRANEDEADTQRQRSLRGRFIITSLARGGEQSLIENGKKGIDLAEHVSSLCLSKYKVAIKKEEISSCYYLKKGGISLNLWDQGPGSSFQNLVNNIKSNRIEKDINVYFNFMLTRRRSTLLYEVRQAKKSGNVTKFWSDEEGNISVQIGQKERRRITNFFDQDSESFKTLYIKELFKQ